MRTIDSFEIPASVQRCFSTCHDMLVMTNDDAPKVVETVRIRGIADGGFYVALAKHADKPLQPLLFAETLWCKDAYYQFSIGYGGELEIRLKDGSAPEFDDGH